MDDRYYRAAEIYSERETATRPARRGLLPIKSAQFYKLLTSGRFPEPDATIGKTRLWRGSTIEQFITRQ